VNRSTLLGFAVGPIGAGILSAISLPILAWIFPPDEIGMLSMLKVAIGFSTLLFSLGLDQAYVREYHEYPDKPGLLRMAVMPGLTIMLAGGILVSIWLPEEISQLLYGVSNSLVGRITLGCLLVALISRFLSLILRMQDRGLAYSMSQILPRALLLSIALAYAIFGVSRKFVVLLLAQTSAWLATLVVFAWNTRRDWIPAIRSSIDRILLRRMFTFGSPLILSAVAAWGLRALDRLFLRSLSTYDELAVYSVAASMAAGATVFGSIFNVIWAPMIYRWVADREDMKRVDDITEIMTVLVCLGVFMVGGMAWIVPIVLPAAYRDVVYIVAGCTLMPLLYTLSEATGIGITVSRKTEYAMMISFVSVALNVVLCLLLVPHWGATGATLATASTFWLFFVLKTEVSARVWRSTERWHLYAAATVLLVFSATFAILGHRSLLLSTVAWWAMFVVLAIWQRQRLAVAWQYIAHGWVAEAGESGA